MKYCDFSLSHEKQGGTDMARTLQSRIEKLSAVRKNKINKRVKKLIDQEIKLLALKESQGRKRAIDRSRPKDGLGKQKKSRRILTGS